MVFIRQYSAVQRNLPHTIHSYEATQVAAKKQEAAEDLGKRAVQCSAQGAACMPGPSSCSLDAVFKQFPNGLEFSRQPRQAAQVNATLRWAVKITAS